MRLRLQRNGCDVTQPRVLEVGPRQILSAAVLRVRLVEPEPVGVAQRWIRQFVCAFVSAQAKDVVAAFLLTKMVIESKDKKFFGFSSPDIRCTSSCASGPT